VNQSGLRLKILYMWGGACLISIVLVLLAPLRPDEQIGDEQILDIVFSIVAIWLPALSCLTAFWFPTIKKEKLTNRVVAKEQATAALIITLGYMIVVVMLVIYPLFIVDYSSISLEPQAGKTLSEQIARTVKIALLLSPIALAPINWLTGGSEHAEKDIVEDNKQPSVSE
jgi:uncharacterized membrane protein